MICPRCQTPNSDQDKFCEQCGAPLPAQAQQAPAVDEHLSAPTMLAGPGAPAVLVRLGPDGGTPYSLGGRAVVGRLDSCDVPVNDKSVSREHARLSRLRDGYVIEDLGSTNGTLVNGTRIHEAVLLRPGDRVTIGSVDFRYDVESPAGEPEPPRVDVSPGAMVPSATIQPEPQMAGSAHEPGEVPTMHDVPPVPMSFPPLEPFAASGEVVSTEQAPPAEPAQEISAPQPAPAVAASASAASEELPAEPPPTPQRVETAREPVAAGRSAESGGSGGEADEAVALATRLGSVLGDLTQQLNDRQASVEQLQQRVAELEQAQKESDKLKALLRELPGPSMQRDQLRTAQDILDSLVQNPRDVAVLMQLGEQAPALGALVDEYGQMRRTLDKLTRELNL